MRHRVDYLDGLRAIAIFMVVGIHAIHYTNVETSSHNVFMFLLTSVAVPIFFFVDGYLFSTVYEGKELKYLRYVGKSAGRLIVPWLIFSIFYIMIRYAGEAVGLFGLEVVRGKSISEILLLLYSSGVSSQLYFLPALFVIRVMAFVIKKYLSMSVFFMCLTCVLYVSLFHILHIDKLSPVPLDPFVHAAWGLQFYLLGILTKDVEKAGGLLYGLVVLSIIVIGVYTLSTSSFAALQILYLYCAYYICKYIPSVYKWFVFVGKETMGIYLIHAPIVIYGFSAILNRYIYDQGILFVVIWVTTFFMSLYISSLISHFRIGALLFGVGKLRL